MAEEIERKFLTCNDQWRDLAEGIAYRQGYLSSTPERTVRVRTKGNQAFLTIKGKSIGLTRAEFEYSIPYEDAGSLLDLCEKPLIDKKRYTIKYAGFIWEVDEFFGDNQGLVLAEIELSSEDQAFEKPAWLGPEVSSDPRYYNANLIHAPYNTWT